MTTTGQPFYDGSTGTMESSGIHLLVDLWGIDAPDGAALERSLAEACRAGGATVVASRFHRFEPHGATGVVLLAESHLAIHTWPEHRYAALDVFTCGRCAVADAIVDEVLRRLRPERVEIRRVPRGAAPRPVAVAGGGR